MKIKVNSELTQTVDDILYDDNKNLISQILLLAYPIGSYYWSNENTDPGTLFGGTWVQIKDKFVIAAGDSHTAGSSYGSNTKNLAHTHTSAAHKHTTSGHTLTPNEMPEHSHTEVLPDTWNFKFQVGSTNGYVSDCTTGAYASQPYNSSFTTGTTGGGQAHTHGDTGSTTPGATGSALSSSFDITPACIAAFCWRRIA